MAFVPVQRQSFEQTAIRFRTTAKRRQVDIILNERDFHGSVRPLRR
jgi:hypothetical protein